MFKFIANSFTPFAIAACVIFALTGCEPKSTPPTASRVDGPAAQPESTVEISGENSGSSSSPTLVESKSNNENAADIVVDPNAEAGVEASDTSEATVKPSIDDSISSRQFDKDGEIRILAWNIESDGANPNVIAQELKAMQPYDIYAFSEVHPKGFPALKRALGSGYTYKYSKSGFNDRLAFAIRTDRFEILDWYEFNAFKNHIINPGNYRAPFVFELRDKTTGRQFEIVLNHLARGKAEIREEQALAIRLWAQSEKKPIIALGDYNFDYVFDSDKGNPAMDVFLEGKTFQWIRPVPMVDSNYYDEDKDGKDDFVDSLLDFVFAAGDAQKWDLDCQVVVRDGDFPDDDQRSDHRPVQLIIKP